AVGALSDRTVTRWGRRTPYFLIGAVLCSLCLLAMPYSPALWVAASLLWILDAANNITMEPYRAYVGDRLDESQRPVGFLTQSAFTGLAQTLSYLSPSILVWWGMDLNAIDPNGIPQVTKVAFLIGAGLSLGSILWSVLRVPELPLTEAEVAEMRSRRLSAAAMVADICDAVVAMPPAMKRLAVAMLFQWYAMFAYWQYISHALSRSLFDTADAGSEGFRQAVLATGQLGGLYNFVAFLAAFALIPLTRRVGPRRVHAVCVALAGCAMLAIPHLGSREALVVPMIGIGLGWASLMGCPYIMLANSIPPARTGIYMGIFNMFIVLPMLVETLTMPLIYMPLLGGDARNVLVLAGVFLLIAGAATLAVGRTGPRVGAA
ncbi:MAG: SLC45 family MFS transporter, partial [Sphingomonadales bacterium]|nr:SLC45 family MFS transporter [Sphingomonadales bacterium]